MDGVNLGSTHREALDKVGIVASTSCAVHCALGGLLTTFTGARLAIDDERLEAAFVFVALVFAGASIALAFRRHQRWLLAQLVLSVALIGAGRWVETGETVLSIAGAASLVAMHVANLRSHRAPRRCCVPSKTNEL